ncbi:glycosyltransferase [Duganella sp. FT80W]|uniref:Glycosyltransferase n=1 Tax=Duganella guangzhouensis TaxID=2666084 RepID=A0A6I2L3A1_9BURK|nr:glycosyltransferase family 2 protein [Duganella guangzhouensis]MRW92591.1 glycosyltransferase [Duganella guangzhouensis]
MSSALISVVITTYNRPDALTAVVQALFTQDNLGFEIIIADDGSGHNTQQAVAALQARSPVPLRHVWQEDLGFRAARARNLGTLDAKGDYIIFLDGDCVPQRDFISQHRKLAQAGYLVQGSRILLNQQATARVLSQPLDLQALSAGEKLAWRRSGALNKVLPLLLSLPDIGRTSTRFSWRRIKSCNLAVWRVDLERVNGFDESFLGWGHEDSDLVVRLYNAGVMRKDGAYATEVFHLWHKEAARDQETSNRAVVLQRAVDRTIEAVKGLRG